MLETEKLKKKINKYRIEGKWEVVSNLCRKLAELHSSHGHYQEAADSYLEELQACEILGDTSGVALANRMVGEMYTEVGHFQTALDFVNKYVDYAKAAKDKVEEQRAYATLGRTYFCWAAEVNSTLSNEEIKSLLKQARKAHVKCLFICENELSQMVGNKEKAAMKARALYNLGLIAELQEDFIQSQDYITKSIYLCKQENLYEDLHRCYVSQGLLFLKLEETQKALISFDKAFDAARHVVRSCEKKVIALQHKAEVYFSMNNFVCAKNTLVAAYKLKSPVESDHMCVEKLLKLAIALQKAEEKLLTTSTDDFTQRKHLYEKLGDGCCGVKNFKHAIQYYLLMLECAEKLGETGVQLLPCYTSLSQTFKDNKQYDLALTYCGKELKCSSSPADACKTYLSMAEIYEVKSEPFTEISEILYKALSKAQEAQDTKLQICVYKNLINLQRKFKRQELATHTEGEMQKLTFETGSSNEDSDEEVEDTPDIGEDINLEDIITDSDGEKEEYDRPKRRQAFKIKRNEKGETQLHLAAIKGDLGRTKSLVEQGHPVKVADTSGWTPLHEACNHGFKEIVEFLLDHGADINDSGGKECEGITPLHDTATNGHFDIIRLLLERGASVTALNDNGETPLDNLRDWKQRMEKKGLLTDDDEEQCKKLEQQMKTMLEAAGYLTDNFTRTQTKSLTNKTKKKTVNLRRGEEDDLENGRRAWTSASPERELSALIPEESGEHACREYQNAIDNLRNHKQPVSSTTEGIVKNDNALLPEDEYVDEWLEDDLGLFEPQQKNKKRKISSYFEHDRTRSKRKSDELLPSPELDDISETISNEQPSHQVPQRKFKKQLTLLPVVERTPRPPQDDGVDEAAREGEEVTDIIRTSQVQPHVNQSLSKIRIKIEDKLFLIPTFQIENLTIRWLCEELSRRYNKLEGTEPLVRLKTKDGAILSDEDPLSLVINEELEAEITGWKTTSIVDRYKEACTGSPPDTYICTALEKCRVTRILDLKYLALTQEQLNPVFKSLKQDTDIREVYLNGNMISDECLSTLCEAISKMDSLTSLDLSCSNISDVSVRNLAQVFQNKSKNCLNVLNLSFNPLTDGCLPHVDKIVSLINNLKSLSLYGCDLSTDFNFQLRDH